MTTLIDYLIMVRFIKIVIMVEDDRSRVMEEGKDDIINILYIVERRLFRIILISSLEKKEDI